jgi:DnaJ-domain-containing protein 1
VLKYTLKRAMSILQGRIASATARSPDDAGQEPEPGAESNQQYSGSADTARTRGPADKRLESLRILELNADASPEDIKRAYRRLCTRFHPDRFANDPEKLKVANDLFTRINEAYDFLQKHGGGG